MVSYSTDGGGSWTRCNLSGTESGFAYALAVAPSQPSVIYAGGQVAGQSAVYYSGDSGRNWVRTATSPGDTVFGLLVDEGDADRVYAATPRGVFVTGDRGGSWTSLPSGGGVRALDARPVCFDTVYCGGDSGVAVSRDRGQTWTSMNQGLASTRVTCLEFGPRRLIAGTASGACYAWELGTGVAADRPAGAGSDELSILPSPGSGVLTMRAPKSIGRALRVSLSDVSGRQVLAVKAEGSLFRVDGRGLSAGVYLVEVEGESGRAGGRVVMAR